MYINMLSVIGNLLSHVGFAIHLLHFSVLIFSAYKNHIVSTDL